MEIQPVTVCNIDLIKSTYQLNIIWSSTMLLIIFTFSWLDLSIYKDPVACRTMLKLQWICKGSVIPYKMFFCLFSVRTQPPFPRWFGRHLWKSRLTLCPTLPPSGKSSNYMHVRVPHVIKLRHTEKQAPHFAAPHYFGIYQLIIIVNSGNH